MRRSELRDALIETAKLSVMIYHHLGRADLCAVPWVCEPALSLCGLDMGF
jgi:hypothetical protein